MTTFGALISSKTLLTNSRSDFHGGGNVRLRTTKDRGTAGSSSFPILASSFQFVKCFHQKPSQAFQLLHFSAHVHGRYISGTCPVHPICFVLIFSSRALLFESNIVY